MARRKALMRNSGPYYAESYSQMGEGVRIVIYAAYPQYGEDWPQSRMSHEGGGPGIFTAMTLTELICDFLNAPYSKEEVATWRREIQKLLGREPDEPWGKLPLEERVAQEGE